MSAAATEGRLARLRTVMAEQGLDTVAVRSTSDIHWLTGFGGVFDDERAHLAVVTAGGAWLHTDSRYDKALASRAQGTPWEVSGEAVRHAAYLQRIVADAGAARVAIEDDLPLREWRQWSDAVGEGVELVETSELVLSLRAVKDDEELALISQAQAITDDAFEHMCEWLAPGVTEREAAFELDQFLRRHGEGLAFDTICAAGDNAANPHHVPGDAVAKTGELFLMDFGAHWHGYDSDMTRTVAIGEPTAAACEVHGAVREANERCEAMIRPGVKGCDVHSLAQQILDEAGFGQWFGHGLGHGVGLDIHELPNLNTRNDKPLEPGNVVTVEPGVYLPGVAGVRLEDFGVVTDDGFSIFTRAPHDLIVL